MTRLLSVGRGSSSSICEHVYQSGQLRREERGALTAWLVCDDCEETIGFLPHQTADAGSHGSQPSTPER